MTTDRPSRIISAIRALFDERNRGTSRGRLERGQLTVDYSITLGGFEDVRESVVTPTSVESPGITVRPCSDGLIVFADLEPVETEAVSVEIERSDRSMTVFEGEVVLARIPLDDGGWSVADTSLNHGILAVRLTNE